MAVHNDRATSAVFFERLHEEFVPTLCTIVRVPLI
jgi:hypothetical protein